MTPRTSRWEAKDPAEIIVGTFDFTKDLAGASITPGAPVMEIEVHAGVDAGVATMIFGAAQVQGGLVLQLLRNGLADVNYHLRCTVDLSDGRRVTLAAYMPVTRF